MNHTHVHGFRRTLIGIVVVAILFGLLQGSLDLQAQSGGSLGYGSRVYGAISATTPLITYSFTGQQGDYVAVTADSWTGTLDIQLELVAPNGVVLDRRTPNTPAGEVRGAQLTVFLPEMGVYVLRLSGENGSVGDYILTIWGRGAATATPLVYGQALDVTVAAGAAAQYFAFEAQDCPTTLVVSDPSEGLPYTFPFVVKLRDQRGETVALLRGGDQLEDWVTVEASSGRYEVEVLAADPTLSGSLRLLVTCADENPGCTPVAGQSGDVACAPCPPIEQWVPGGGCPDLHFTALQDADAPNWVTVTWDSMPAADGYAVYVTGLIEGGGEVYLTHADWVPGDPLHFTWILPAEGYTGFDFTLQIIVDGVVICTQSAHVDITAPDVPEQFTGQACAIRADREGVAARVGPGTLRSIFSYLNPGIEYTVVGWAMDEDGNRWWQVDKTQFTGHEGVISLWVAQADVVPIGDCNNVPQTDIPEVVPIPDDDVPPGGWGACGSCDTCGHPADECVTSPEGVCLWDPSTCANAGQVPPGDGQCFSITVTIDMGQCFGAGSAMLDTPPNCQGTMYAPGTMLQAHAVAVDAKCYVHSWTGCGASGSGSSITFVPPGSCTLTAHMGY